MSEKTPRIRPTSPDLQVRAEEFPQEELDGAAESSERKKEIKISTALPEDTAAIQDVAYRTSLGIFPNEELNITADAITETFKSRLSEDGIEKAREAILHPAEGTAVLVAKEGDEIVGVCTVSVSEKENRIQSFSIPPEKRQSKIEIKLWEEAEKLFDSAKDIRVGVTEYDLHTRQFFRRRGLVKTAMPWRSSESTLADGTLIPQIEMELKASTRK